MEDFLEKFGKRVQYYRKEVGYSQELLAEKVNTNPQSISKIENGKYFVKYPMLKKLCEALEIDVWQLFMYPKDENIEEHLKTKLNNVIDRLPLENLKILYKIARSFLD